MTGAGAAPCGNDVRAWPCRAGSPEATFWYPGSEAGVRPGQPQPAGAPHLRWRAVAVEPDRRRRRPPDGRGADRANGRPLVLYFPGWDGRSIDNPSLIAEIAASGFVVCALRYPADPGASAQSAEPDGPIDLSSERAFDRTVQIAESKVRRRTSDAIAVLDWIAASRRGGADMPPFGAVDEETVGAVGFSLGGAVAAETCIRDPRVRAAVNLDGWHFGDALAQGVPKPYLFISDDSQGAGRRLKARLTGRPYGMLLDERNAISILTNMARNGGHVLVVRRSRHQDFCEGPRSVRAAVSARIRRSPTEHVRRIVSAYTREFLHQHLHGEPSALLRPDRPADVRTRLVSFARCSAAPSELRHQEDA